MEEKEGQKGEGGKAGEKEGRAQRVREEAGLGASGEEIGEEREKGVSVLVYITISLSKLKFPFL